MKKLLISFIAFLMLAAFTNLKAQKGFSIHAGGSFPLGGYIQGYGLFPYEGSAAVGFNLGVKYLYEFKLKGLGAFINADFDFNGLKKAQKQNLDDFFEDDNTTYSKSLNFPIIAGLQYKYKISDQIAIFGNTGLGADILKITTMKSSGERAGEDSWEFKYKTNASLGFKIGVGAIFKEKFLVDLNFNFLGNHEISCTRKITDNGIVTKDNLPWPNQKVTIMNLTVGVKL